jgi:hypothetical protein
METGNKYKSTRLNTVAQDSYLPNDLLMLHLYTLLYLIWSY